jgi:hypothetical protein
VHDADLVGLEVNARSIDANEVVGETAESSSFRSDGEPELLGTAEFSIGDPTVWRVDLVGPEIGLGDRDDLSFEDYSPSWWGPDGLLKKHPGRTGAHSLDHLAQCDPTDDPGSGIEDTTVLFAIEAYRNSGAVDPCDHPDW